jgi:hypothetical protein
MHMHSLSWLASTHWTKTAYILLSREDKPLLDFSK